MDAAPLCGTGAGRWGDAVEYYGKAAALAPTFSFAAANRALALYQLGQREPAIRWEGRAAPLQPSSMASSLQQRCLAASCLH
jgi:tetratricopeptide (TPR) repeat protein